MIWDILEDKLKAAQLTIPAVWGETLFRHAMPANVAQGVMLKNPLAGIKVDPYIPGFYKPQIQLISRHTKPEIGDIFANEIVKALQIDEYEDFPENASRGRVRIHVFYPTTLPIQFPRLDGNGFEWSINFTTAFAIQPK